MQSNSNHHIPSPETTGSDKPTRSLPWPLFILPPAFPISVFGILFSLDTIGSGLNPHGFAGLFVLIGAAAELGVIALNAFLVPWSIWRMATSRTQLTLANILLVLLAVLTLALSVGHLTAPTIGGW
jgi:hypothetical protein